MSINCSNITTATAKSRLNQENWEEPIENDEEKAEDDSLIENLVDLFESKKPKPRCTASCKRLRLKESSNDETVNQDTKRLVNNKIKSCKIVKFAKIDKDSRLIYPKSPLEVNQDIDKIQRNPLIVKRELIGRKICGKIKFEEFIGNSLFRNFRKRKLSGRNQNLDRKNSTKKLHNGIDVDNINIMRKRLGNMESEPKENTAHVISTRIAVNNEDNTINTLNHRINWLIFN